MYPEAYDQTNPLRPPTSAELNLLAKHREEPQSEEGSSADEGVSSKGSGWCGTGEPMSVGIGYTSREYCDGQSLASPGRWRRRYPDTVQWQSVVSSYVNFTEQHGTKDLLMNLALGRERVSIQASRRTSAEGRGGRELGVNGHGSHKVLRRRERRSDRLSFP